MDPLLSTHEGMTMLPVPQVVYDPGIQQVCV
jgi:hypothetical protein